MSNITVTRYTLAFAGLGGDSVGAVEDLAVAFAAIGFDHSEAILFDLHRFLEMPGGESPGMPYAVNGLGFVFAKEVMGAVAAVAIRGQSMT
jgi:hypothetical protein